MCCTCLVVGSPKITWTASAGGSNSRAAGFIHKWQRTVFRRLVTTDKKTWIYHWALISKLEWMQWKDVDRPTFTRICKSATNLLDYGNSFFSGIQDRLLMTNYKHPGKTTTGQYYAEPTFKLLDVIKQKQWQKWSVRSWDFFMTMHHHTSLLAQQALCNCKFVQLNHPAYSLDLAPSNYFLIRSPKYADRLRGTWFIVGESLKLAVEAWFGSQNRKFYYQGINSWEQKLKICIDVAWEYVKNDDMCYIIC